MHNLGTLSTNPNQLPINYKPGANSALQVTNHVKRGPAGELQAGLGLSWSHVPRTRVLLERCGGPGPLLGSTCTATLVKSSRQVP